MHGYKRNFVICTSIFFQSLTVFTAYLTTGGHACFVFNQEDRTPDCLPLEINIVEKQLT